MPKHILVTYATRAGSTAEVAMAIGEILVAHGFCVDVKPIKEMPKVEHYDAILIGSAVRMGHWLPEAISFVEINQDVLSQLPVALFTVHLNNLGDDEESRHNRQAYLNAVRPLLDPVDEIFFAGKLDYTRLSFLARLMAKAMKATEEDRRDRKQIRGRAEDIVPTLESNEQGEV